MKNYPELIGKVVRALAAWAGLSLLAAPGSGQTTPPTTNADDKETVKLEKFVVTGSLIPIAAETPAVPVTVMSAADIAASGVTNDLTDVLKKTQPFFYGRGNLGTDNANTRSNSTIGASTVSLRNRSTLVLVNGRRAAISPAAAIGAGHYVDVSLIPVAAVERIEVLSDGASATYGTDAVAGVVNIILKTNFRGVEIGGSFSWAPNASDWATRRGYVAFGTGNEKTQVMVTAEWRRSDPLWQYERPWGIGRFLSPTFAGVVNPDPVNFYYLNPNLNAPAANLDLSTTDLVAQGIYSGPFTQSQVQNFLDLSEKATMFLETNRRGLTATVEHKLTETLTGFGDILATQSITESTLNAQPVSSTAAASLPNNPFATSVTVRNRFRAFPRVFNNDGLGLRGVFGLRGTFGDTWNWEVSTGLNRSTLLRSVANQIDAPTYLAALANGTFNPFARLQPPGVLESFMGIGFQDYTTRLISFDLRASGELFTLPAGPVQGGFSLETRSERVEMINDRNERTGAWLGATPTQPFAAKQSVDAFAAEIRIPVFGRERRIRGFQALEVGAAARKEIYSGSPDALVPKFSLRWQPFNDELAARATYSESFSAPDLFSLFGPQNAGFSNTITLTRYDANGNMIGTAVNRQYRQRGGSNPKLVPAESRNWTAGFVWSPRAIKGFNLTFDWFDIDERNLIGTVPVVTLLQSVEQFGPASPFASQVRLAVSNAGELHFDTGAPVTARGQITSGASDAVWMTNPRLNVAGIWQAGFDLKLDYTRDTKRWGRFMGNFTTTYIDNYTVQSLPILAPIDYSATYSGGSGASGTIPRIRTFTRLDWAYKNFSAGLSHTYIPEVDDVAVPTPTPVTSYQTFDFRAGYRFANHRSEWLKGLSVSIGINNLLNEDPPFSPGEQDQFRDINTYDALGRAFNVSASYKF